MVLRLDAVVGFGRRGRGWLVVRVDVELAPGGGCGVVGAGEEVFDWRE